MNKVINFNTAAGAIIGENTKIRTRIKDGVLQVRPTIRTNEKKSVTMFDLRPKAKAFRVSVPADLVGELAFFTVEPTKHGWLALVPGEKQVTVPGQAAAAGGSVSER